MNRKEELLRNVVIKFAGDSGDGMQLTGSQFTNNTRTDGDLTWPLFLIFRQKLGATGDPLA